MQAQKGELAGQRAVVTGGGGGIGRAVSGALAAAGARVAVWGRRQPPLDETLALLAGSGHRAETVDVGRPEAVEAAYAAVERAWGGIDILINNAALQGPIGLTHEVDAAAWASTVQTNLVGPLLCARQVLPGMIERKRGKIVNLSGGGAVSPRPRFSAYGASKAGLVRLTETLAAEVAPWGVDINAVAPGAVSTGMQDEILAAGSAAGDAALKEARQAQEGGESGLARAAALVLFLASSRSDGLSGRLLSAVWDTWEELDIAAVMAGEAYTVRRLKPQDE